MILLIDNYDSFSYNLVQLAGGLNPDIRVVRNDELTVEEIKELDPSHIIISPGPGHPGDAGICEHLIQFLKESIPILGICLGHQAICEVFGSEITHAVRLVHGKQTKIYIDNSSPVFRGLPAEINAARYHSLIARKDSIPDELEVIAVDDMGEVMGIKHKNYNVYGLQFHPESILTAQGSTILENFLQIEYIGNQKGEEL